MARYRSNRGSCVSNNFDRKSNMFDSGTFSGLGLRERSPDVGGAGSMDVYILVMGQL